MTREEALQIIYDHCQHCDETEKAFEILKENKGDLISRQAVLDIWHLRLSDKEIYKAIYELPSVENEGEWIEKEGREEGYDIGGVKTWYVQIMCNKCGFIKTAIEGHTSQYNFCPNCGADMRGE